MSPQTRGPATSLVSVGVPCPGRALMGRVCVWTSVKGCLLRRWAGLLITKVLGPVVWIRSATRGGALRADPSGVWCVQLQGGGGSRRGASATDDNAAGGPPSGGVRARPRDAELIKREGLGVPL